MTVRPLRLRRRARNGHVTVMTSTVMTSTVMTSTVMTGTVMTGIYLLEMRTDDRPLGGASGPRHGHGARERPEQHTDDHRHEDADRTPPVAPPVLPATKQNGTAP